MEEILTFVGFLFTEVAKAADIGSIIGNINGLRDENEKWNWGFSGPTKHAFCCHFNRRWNAKYINQTRGHVRFVYAKNHFIHSADSWRIMRVRYKIYGSKNLHVKESPTRQMYTSHLFYDEVLKKNVWRRGQDTPSLANFRSLLYTYNRVFIATWSKCNFVWNSCIFPKTS